MKTIRIALVDDHILVREGIRTLLSMVEHFEIAGEAGSGSEALELVAREQPDILLMDIGLKDINGLELTGIIKKRHPATKVLILSMYDNQEYVSSSLRMGASGYVLKEAPSQDIISAIDVLAVGGRFYSGDVAHKLAQEETEEGELTPRERQVLLMMAQGLNNKAMARELAISVRTVETYRLNIRRKLDIEKPADLVKRAMEYGWSPQT
ncbi:response regulator [Pseudomonas fulva]|uniref:Two component transcriptional regulator, LuxR family n=1 Tax=Pseudomonas fulva (strain 12-X) TaxID=743720 RepID=F6AI95_PSEF1|nr:response regulator transcription factor [Pseudomonas fulva]AEF23921.1 two component transcriptional regulator, LuxR family [Pseudomonas fulva 12-X]